MFKFRKRLARGIDTTQDGSTSKPCKATTSAGMGSTGDEARANDSVINDQTDGGAVHEPLVLDFATMHDGHQTKHQNPPLTPPPSQNASQDPDNWFADADQDTPAAPAPPDFTRRGIHIPSRTS